MAEPHCLQILVDRLSSRAPLTEADKQAVLALPFSIRSLDAGKYLIREGDTPQACAVLLTGFVARLKIVSDGVRQIVSFHLPGDILDLQNSMLDVADHDLQALKRAEAALIPLPAMLGAVLSSPTLSEAMWRETLIEASIAREWVANVGRRDSRQRIAHILCEFALRLEAAGLGDRLRFEMPMTQEQIADSVGLTAVHVNRTLRHLDRDGLTTRTRRSVVIHDWTQLARAGDFRATYLHLPEVGGAGTGTPA